MDGFSFRKAAPGDVPLLWDLIQSSARGLSQGDYTQAQVESALGSAWGVDTQMIGDGTYFVVEAQGRIVACGGWSRRGTLFGADAQTGREPAPLDPAKDPARIRAFFVHPAWARRGIGRALLERCEAEAKAAGFRSARLVATLPGERLYRAFGYVGEGRRAYPLPDGGTIDFIPMTKERL